MSQRQNWGGVVCKHSWCMCFLFCAHWCWCALLILYLQLYQLSLRAWFSFFFFNNNKNQHKTDHISPVFHSLHWLPILQRIQYKINILCHNCITCTASSYLCHRLQLYTPAHTLLSFWYQTFIVQELCESRGGRPGLSVLTSLMISVDVKQCWTMFMHWSQFVPDMLTDIWGH